MYSPWGVEAKSKAGRFDVASQTPLRIVGLELAFLESLFRGRKTVQQTPSVPRRFTRFNGLSADELPSFFPPHQTQYETKVVFGPKKR